MEDNTTIEKYSKKKIAIYLAMSILGLGGLLVIIFILTGAQGDYIFRSFLTLILLSLFSFAMVGESGLAERNPIITSVGRITALVIILIAGAWHIWSPYQLDGKTSNYDISVFEFTERFGIFLGTVIVMQCAALFFSLYGKFYKQKKLPKSLLRVLLSGLTAFSAAALMLTIIMTFPHITEDNAFYWRALGALLVLGVILILITVIGSNLYKDKNSEINTKILDIQHGISNTTQQVSAGWYKDPTLAEVERFWDGESWTIHTRPEGIETLPKEFE